MKITSKDLKDGKVSIPSLAEFFDKPENLKPEDLELVLTVFNKYFDEPVQVDPPLHQCINCKKLIEIKRGDNICKCGQGVYWGEI